MYRPRREAIDITDLSAPVVYEVPLQSVCQKSHTYISLGLASLLKEAP